MRSVADTLNTLWTHARDHVPDAELATLANGTNYAEIMARQMGRVCSGLAVLIDEDQSAASFANNADLASLIYTLGIAFETVGGLVQVGQESADLLDERARSAAKESGGRE